MDLATYRYLVDWDNGPAQSPPVNPFLGTYDDISAYVLKADWSYGSDSGSPGSTKAGSATIILDNSSSIFSSYNATSDIYGKILPGIRVRIQMKIGLGAWATMWQGALDSIVPTVGDLVSISTATLQAYGPLQQPSEDADVDIAMQTDITTGAAMDLILDAAGFPAGDRDIDTGHSTMSRFWSRKGKVLELLRELEAEETGLLRETKDGKIQHEDRGHRAAAPHTTPRSTYGTGTLRPWNLQQENPLLDIYNSVTAQIRTFNKTDVVTLATIVDVRNGLGGPPIPIASGQTKVIDIQVPTPSTPSQYLAVETWGTVNLQIYTNDDGTGTDLTNLAGMTLSRQELGRTLRCTIVNGTGSSGYIVVLSALGSAIVEGDPITVTAEDATSQSKFRKRAFPSPSQWLTKLDEGQDYCDHIIALYKNPRPALRFVLKANYDATHLAEAQAIDVSDRIHITASEADFGLCIDGDFFVESLRHTVNEARIHEVQVYCRAIVAHSWPPSGTPYTAKVVPPVVSGGNPYGATNLQVLTTEDDATIPNGCIALQWSRETGNYKSIYVVAAWLSFSLPAEGPYYDERNISPSAITETGTCTVAKGSKSVAVTRPSPPSTDVVGRVFLIYTSDASPDSDLDGNIIVEESPTRFTLSAPFGKSGTFSYAVVKRWWDRANGESNNIAYYQWPVGQVTPDVESPIWRTPAFPAPTGSFYVTLTNRNEYGLGTELVGGGATSPSIPAEVAPGGCTELSVVAGEVDTNADLGSVFYLSSASGYTINNPTGTLKCGRTLLWMLAGAGVPTLDTKFRLMDSEVIIKSSGRDLLGAIYNLVSDQWDTFWKKGP